MMTISCQKMPENAKIFYCEKCDFKCFKQSNYDKHLSTRKHKMITNDDQNSDTNRAKLYMCICGKKYKFRQGLHVHRKKSCTYYTEDSITGERIESIKKDSEKVEFCKEIFPYLKDVIHEIMPKMQPTTVNTTNNNHIYNINTFLNEQCKDAMNLSDFIESIQLSIQDIERIGYEGQTTGMANIMIDKLNGMDVFQRPMHCSDIKKETIYIKDKDKWDIEKKDRPKLKHALRKIYNKSVNCLYDASHTENFEKMCMEVLNIEDDKIISKIVKNVVLNEGNKKIIN